jgi:exodeoxyribonuclease VII small subunit
MMGKSKKSFEEAISELEDIVEKLEKGELMLEESLECFQRGIELSKYCSKKLDEVEKKISILVENEQGNIIEEMLPEV